MIFSLPVATLDVSPTPNTGFVARNELTNSN
jgi:hypothetical protein